LGQSKGGCVDRDGYCACPVRTMVCAGIVDVLISSAFSKSAPQRITNSAHKIRRRKGSIIQFRWKKRDIMSQAGYI
jgi:hypothetical protein